MENANNLVNMRIEIEITSTKSEILLLIKKIYIGRNLKI
jgi:hypothetical protein